MRIVYRLSINIKRSWGTVNSTGRTEVHRCRTPVQQAMGKLWDAALLTARENASSAVALNQINLLLAERACKCLRRLPHGAAVLNGYQNLFNVLGAGRCFCSF